MKKNRINEFSRWNKKLKTPSKLIRNNKTPKDQPQYMECTQNTYLNWKQEAHTKKSMIKLDPHCLDKKIPKAHCFIGAG